MKKATAIALLISLSVFSGCSLKTEHVHDLEIVAEKAATCTEGGNIEHLRCRDCGDTFSYEDGNEPIEDVSIPAKGHTLDNVDAKPATLEAEGTEAYWKCSECDKIFSDEAGVNETSLSALMIPKGFAKLYSGTVTEGIGGDGGPFKDASASSPVIVDAFYMALTETTYERWCEVYTWAESEGYTFANPGREGNDGVDGALPTDAKKEPVTYISWRDAIIWCNAASEMEGKSPVYYVEGTMEFDSENVLRFSDKQSEAVSGSGQAEKAVINENADGYRLPTEAEWEYAARGGDPSATEWNYKYSGTNSDEDLGGYAVYLDNSESNTADVATKKPNSAGLFDMSGNVWEWCQEEYSGSGSNRVSRGGSWNGADFYSAVAYRISYSPYYRIENIGFRVVFASSN